MRKVEMKEIEIDGEKYPYYCDLFVLSKIQDRMSLQEFERQVIGAVIVRTETGEPEYDKDGRIVLEFDHYVIDTLIMGLTLMINEGLQIKADEDGQQAQTVSEADIGRRLAMPLNELSDIVHEAFNRCFVVKKNITRQAGTRKKTSR